MPAIELWQAFFPVRLILMTLVKQVFQANAYLLLRLLFILNNLIKAFAL